MIHCNINIRKKNKKKKKKKLTVDERIIRNKRLKRQKVDLLKKKKDKQVFLLF